MNNYFKYIFNRIVFFIVLLLFFCGTLVFLGYLLPQDQQAYILVSLGAAMLTCLAFLAYRWIYVPYVETQKILNIFISGYTTQGIVEIRHHITPEIEAAINKFEKSFHTNELMNATRRQAQYLALQNQINPHFLYNTLEGIRSEALIANLTTVADMTEALGNFFRYTISNMDHLVYLEDELVNVENYYLIQQYRFGEKISLNIVYDKGDKETLLKYQLPKLTLQPIIENAIYHGIERKMGNGTITIRIEATKKRLIITISDDGLGMSKQQLDELLSKLNIDYFEYISQVDEEKGGIAIVNVNNRIKLLFGETYGINIFSTSGVGTDVEITLPLMSGN